MTTNTEQQKGVQLVWSNVNFQIPIPNPYIRKQKIDKIILQDVSGYANPQELLAVMGSSGSGKSALLNVLSDRIQLPKGGVLTGDIKINGIKLDNQCFGKIAAYVMQDDILFASLTSRECFEFAASLRLTCSAEERKKRVDSLVSTLSLEKAQHTKVGNVMMRGLSGGERKRTSIGVELITDPKIILLDEPTTGLDSFTALKIILLLKKLASQGKTIIFSIQQPSTNIFDEFHRLLLIVKGQIIYQGRGVEFINNIKTPTVLNYFNELLQKELPKLKINLDTNPADELIKLMHGIPSKKQLGKYIEEDENKFTVLIQNYITNQKENVKKEVEAASTNLIVITPDSIKNMRVSSFCAEFKELMQRSFKNVLRNPGIMKMRMIQIVFMSVILLFLYTNRAGYTSSSLVLDKNGCFLFVTMNQFMLSYITVVLIFPDERKVFLREQANKTYSVGAYYISKIVTELPIQILAPLLYSLIIYFAIGFRLTAEAFFVFFLILVLLSLNGYTLGILLGASFHDSSTATVIMPAVILPFMLFCGALANLDTIAVWLRWLQYISPIRYSLEALFRNEYRKEDFIYNAADPLLSYPVDNYSYSIGMWECIAILAGYAVLYIIMGGIILRMNVKKMQA